jgi:1-acyl-sn-glycerol-3-phosphate acyltransferase
MRSVLVSLWVWFAIGALIVLWVPIMVVARLVDRDPAHYYAGYTLRIMGRLFTYANPFWEVQLEGPFPDDPRHPYVVVGNHFSQADPPIIARVPWEMKWVAKKALFDLPFAGWLLRLSGDISVDRGSKKSRAQVVTTARDYLAKRCSVMFFPEGTRSRDGRVHRFSDGAFRLAIEEGVPVLPIAIDGTHEALPKHSIWFDPNPEPIRVRVLDPVETDGYTPDQARALQRHVRARIVRQIADWRGASLDAVDGRSGTDAAAAAWLAAGPDRDTAPDGNAPPQDPPGNRPGDAQDTPPGEASVKPSPRSDTSEPGR